MNRSNTYIFIYASVMVILVAIVLSLASTTLKPYQTKNEEVARKLDILKSVGKGLEANQANSKTTYVETEYSKYITESVVINIKGDTVSGLNAFDINLAKELIKDPSEMNLPIFVCTQDDGSKNYIFPVRGKGLWGPIWGYIALKDNMNTIAGVVFDHKAETPGLGSEINTVQFQEQFINKKILDETGGFVSISVNKASEPKSEFHSVDAISGGTITSNGLEKMISDCMKNYLSLINVHK